MAQDADPIRLCIQLDIRTFAINSEDAPTADTAPGLSRAKIGQLLPITMEELIGMFTSGLAGFAARCGGRDLIVRRAIDKAVFDLRADIASACTALADERGEPALDDGA
jgi:hypothetical protein